MFRSIRSLLVLAALAIPITVHAQGFRDLIDRQAMSQSIPEYVEILIAAPDLPPGHSDEPATVTYRLELPGDSYGVNFVDVDAAIGGFARFKIEVGSSSGKGRILLVNDQELCCAFEDADRVMYQVSVRHGENATFLSGGEIPILGQIARGTTVAITHIDSGTGATHSRYIMRPVIRAETYRADDDG